MEHGQCGGLHENCPPWASVCEHLGPVGGAIWGPVGGAGFLEEVQKWERFSLVPAVKDVSSQLPAPSATLPCHDRLFSWNREPKTLSLKLPWPWCLIIAKKRTHTCGLSEVVSEEN